MEDNITIMLYYDGQRNAHMTRHNMANPFISRIIDVDVTEENEPMLILDRLYPKLEEVIGLQVHIGDLPPQNLLLSVEGMLKKSLTDLQATQVSTPSRELALAITKLEESIMWLNKIS